MSSDLIWICTGAILINVLCNVVFIVFYQKNKISVCRVPKLLLEYGSAIEIIVFICCVFTLLSEYGSATGIIVFILKEEK
jgi:hypothetical protein